MLVALIVGTAAIRGADVGGATRAAPIVGSEKSRYPAQSPFWDVAEEAIDVNGLKAPAFRFAWGDARWHAEGAVAMAASVTLQQFVGLGDTHRRFCPERPACNMIDFESKPAEPRFTVRRLFPWPTMPSRDDAIKRCRSGMPDFRNQLRQALEASRGIVLAVYRPNAFATHGSRTQNDSIHLFAMYGIDAQGRILLRDSADRVPITYRLRDGHECEALTIPRAFEVDRSRKHYKNWVLSAWIVESRRAVTPAPVPAPTPVPPPVPSPGPAPFDEDNLPGLPGQDPFDLGAFRLPTTAVISSRLLFDTIGGAPARLRLMTGISQAVSDESRQSLLKLQNAWGVSRVGDSFTFRREQSGDPLSDAYRRLGHSDRRRLDALAARFNAAARRLSKDRRWLAGSVIRYVQNIPYDLVREDALGVRTPVEVINKGGDCDSKSLLAAVLLQLLGFRTIVLTNDALSHAVLGVDLPASGSYLSFGGVRYVLVECTTPAALGDMSMWGLNGDARQRGWEAHVVEL
ncbi:MAG TPA: hypothetical protein VNI54_04855 [Thermoanaerobaculia bacterium]|nr:hypothetical protein [Thermoanaerobaculia bacterium]